MPEATVRVVQKNAPEPGKKRWKVKSESGHTFQLETGLENNIQLNTSYVITYRDDQFGDRKFKVIEAAKPALNQVPQTIQPSQGMANQTYDPREQSFKDETIAALAMIKSQVLATGDRAGIFHALKQSALAYRDFKNWQRGGDDPE